MSEKNIVLGIDLGTTYSCVAYIDENGKPVVLKNSDGELTTPSAVWFESQTEKTVGQLAKDNAVMYPEQVVTFIKRNMGQPGFVRTINGIDMRPEEISSYILIKIVQDAEESLRRECKLGTDEHCKDVVITCPAYFGIAERDATQEAGKLAGLNVLAIINEPTAAAISYGVNQNNQEKTVLVYDLGGGTFDITMINVKADEIRVICTGGNHSLGGKDWDDRILQYLIEQYQEQSGNDITDDIATLQELSLSVERAKKVLTAKEKAPILINYRGDRFRIELTREKFDELTDDLLSQTIDYTRIIFREAEKKGFKQSDISEILLVGGSSYMPQVMRRVKAEFGIDTKMFDPNESVAKGAAIYASDMNAYNIAIEKMAENEGLTIEDFKDKIATGQLNVEEVAKKANVPMRRGRLPGQNHTVINVSSRSFGTVAYDAHDNLKIFNIIMRNAELPARGMSPFCPHDDNLSSVNIFVKESLSSEEIIDPEIGKEIGKVELKLPPGVTRDTEIQITFSLDNSGLLHLHAKEMKEGREIEADFQTEEGMTEEQKENAMRRIENSNVN